MKHTSSIQKMRTAVIGLFMLFGTLAFAQSSTPPVICLDLNQNINLKSDPVLVSIENAIRQQIISGTKGMPTNPAFTITTKFTPQTSSAFHVNQNGDITNFTKSGIVEYIVDYAVDVDFEESYNGSSGFRYFDQCDTSRGGENYSVPGGTRTIMSVKITGQSKGTIALALKLPATAPIITGALCFDNEISLSVQPIFNNFDCEWIAAPTLTANATNQSSVVYDVSNQTNSEYTIIFKVTDNTCTGNSAQDTIVVREKTKKPLIASIDNCVEFGSNSVQPSIANPQTGYHYDWYFRTNNQEVFQNDGPTATINIDNHSGSVFVKAIGLCNDTAISDDVQINRKLSLTENTLRVRDTNCIFAGDIAEFYINPTIEENIIWDYTGSWVKQTDSTGSVFAKVNSDGVVSAKSEACQDGVLQLPITVMSNATIQIVGNTCLEPGTSYSYSVAGLNNADAYFWTFRGNQLPSNTQTISFDIDNTYQGNFGKDSLKVVAVKCGRQFTAAIPIHVEFTGLAIDVNPTCIFAGEKITFTVPINEDVTWTYTGLIKEKEENTLEVKAPNGGKYTIKANNKNCTALIEKEIEVSDSMDIAITAQDTCLTPNSHYSFTATSIPNATYTWTIFGQLDPSTTTNVAQGSVPITTNTNVHVIATVCGRTFPADLTVGFKPATPDPITVTGGKSCINVGMEDTLYVSIPNNVTGATSIVWTATYANGGSAQVVSNGTTAIIITDSAGYGDSLKIEVAGHNNCGNGQARELTMAIEGVGTDYSRTIDNSYGLNGGLVTTACPLSSCCLAPIGSDLQQVLWFINDLPVASSQQAYYGGYLFYPITPTNKLSAILIPSAINSNSCKSKVDIQ